MPSLPPIKRLPRALKAAMLALVAALLCIGATTAAAHTQVQAALTIAAHPGPTGKWLVASPLGLLRSTDGGKTFHWQCSVAFGSGGKLGLTRRTIVHGDGFLLLEDQRLQRSADGCTWHVDIAGLSKSAKVVHIDAAPLKDGNVAWVITAHEASNALWRSVNGAPFEKRALPDKFSPTSVAAVDGFAEHALVVGNLGHEARVLTTTPIGGEVLHTSPAHPDRGALLWLPKSQAPGTEGVLLIRSGGDQAERLWASVDGGKTWQQRLQLPPGDPISGALALAGGATPTIFVSGHEARVHRSTDLAATFQHFPDAPHAPCLHHLDGNLVACADGIADKALIKTAATAAGPWQTQMCLGKIEGPATCGAAQAVCKDLWKYTLIDAAAAPGTCEPLKAADVDASAGGGQDAGGGALDVTGTGKDGGAANGPGGPIGTTPPPSDGCSARNARPGTPNRRFAWLLLTVALLVLSARKTATSRS